MMTEMLRRVKDSFEKQHADIKLLVCPQFIQTTRFCLFLLVSAPAAFQYKSLLVSLLLTFLKSSGGESVWIKGMIIHYGKSNKVLPMLQSDLQRKRKCGD